jgi:hypothetical protein
MEAINAKISEFDENLKTMITNKINKELETSISNIIKKTYDNVIELQCNEYLSNNSTFDLISEVEYKKLRALGITKDRKSIIWYKVYDYYCDGYNHLHKCNSSTNNYFIIYNNGLIESKCTTCCTAKSIYNTWNLNHEPSLACIDTLKLSWSFNCNFCDVLYISDGDRRNEMTHEKLIKGLVEPVIEIFKNQKPYQFNSDVMKVLKLEKYWLDKEEHIMSRETDLLKNETKFEDKQTDDINKTDNIIRDMEEKYNMIKESKKELMKKFIEQEKEIKRLKSQNLELNEKYNLLLEDN